MKKNPITLTAEQTIALVNEISKYSQALVEACGGDADAFLSSSKNRLAMAYLATELGEIVGFDACDCEDDEFEQTIKHMCHSGMIG